jgi:hypothetical protein
MQCCFRRYSGKNKIIILYRIIIITLFQLSGQKYTLTLPCAIDAALFALYFLYRTDLDIAHEFDKAPVASPYAMLAETFDIVEKSSWNIARIHWLPKHGLLKTTDRQPKSSFGTVDESVFCFIKKQQCYTETIICMRPDYTQRERNYSSAELNILVSE